MKNSTQKIKSCKNPRCTCFHKRNNSAKKQWCILATGAVLGAAVALSFVYRKDLVKTADKYGPVVKKVGEEKALELLRLSRELNHKAQQEFKKLKK